MPNDAVQSLDSKPSDPELLKNVAAPEESFSSKVQRELNLLGSGISQGVGDRLSEAVHNPGTTVLEIGTAFAVGAALTAARASGGKYAAAASYAELGLGCLIGLDVGIRTKNAYNAMDEVWSDPTAFERGKDKVAANLGSMLVDYPLAAGGGYLGARAVRSLPLSTFASPSNVSFRPDGLRAQMGIEMKAWNVNYSSVSHTAIPLWTIGTAGGVTEVKRADFKINPVVPEESRDAKVLKMLEKAK